MRPNLKAGEASKRFKFAAHHQIAPADRMEETLLPHQQAAGAIPFQEHGINRQGFGSWCFLSSFLISDSIFIVFVLLITSRIPLIE